VSGAADQDATGDRRTSDRVALVTGGARGIGRAVNEQLARDGYRCVVHYRRDETGAREAQEALQQISGHAVPLLRADFGDEGEIHAMFDLVAATFGRLDVFVANAASTAMKPLLAVESRHAERAFRETITNLIVSFRRAVDAMQDGGRIVFVSGLQARDVFSGYSLLGPAKAAGEEIVKHLAVEVGPRGITANSVVPGFIETVSARRSLGDEYDAMAARLKAMIPVRRGGTPADVAHLVSFLVSPLASFINGQAYVIDGGMSSISSSWLAAALDQPS
jgi:enoyl-[acyl-carrier protein] reductase III